jgi:hypothetical protein
MIKKQRSRELIAMKLDFKFGSQLFRQHPRVGYRPLAGLFFGSHSKHFAPTHSRKSIIGLRKIVDFEDASRAEVEGSITVR